jgi:hypothetical protein
VSEASSSSDLPTEGLTPNAAAAITCSQHNMLLVNHKPDICFDVVCGKQACVPATVLVGGRVKS